MKKILFVSSLTSLVVLSSSAFADQVASAPQLEGGITVSLGTFYAAPGSDTVPYASIITPPEFSSPSNVYPATDYDFGFEAALGYVFEGTANGIELSYRGLNADSDNNTTANEGELIIPPGLPITTLEEASNQLTNEFNSVDLMVSQFLDIGQVMQMRFQAGLAYIDIEQDNNTDFTALEVFTQSAHSEYQGWGPRLGIDARYDFGDDLEGFGIVGGGSVAYFFGELNSNASLVEIEETASFTFYDIQDNTDNHAVLNLRGNLGIDYVYFFDDEESTLGIELGYMADYYDQAINQMTVNIEDLVTDTFDADLVAASFTGPYVNIKGVF